MAQETYEERIKSMFIQLDDRVDEEKLTEYCMDLRVSEFNSLEDRINVLYDTGNEDELTELAEEIKS